MARKGFGNFQKADPTEEVTGKGIAVLLSFFVLFIVLYAISYPLARYADQPLLGIFLSDPFSLSFLALALVGLGLAVMHARDYKANDLLVSLLLAALVGLAVQAQYWSRGWTPYIPYYPPAINSLEVFFMTLGAIGLLKSDRVLHFRLAENDDRAAAKSLGLGIALGVPFAIINVLLLLFTSSQNPSLQDVLTSAVIALRPGIIEEVAFRLLFMGLAMVILLKYLPKKIAIPAAIFMAIVFHSALHFPDLITSSPLVALGMIVFTSILFGLPMAYLAYKRDIETAIGFHWVIDAVRFAMGL